MILTELYNVPVQITTDVKEFRDFQGPKINYSREDIKSGLWILPHSLLFENEVIPQQIEVTDTTSLPVIFRKGEADPGFYFDVFAASFFMVSRYEEYLSPARDKHYRFLPQASLALRYGFLSRPVVNEWAAILIRELVVMYPTLDVKKPIFNFLSSIDIDHLYAHRGRSLVRLFGGWLSSITRGMPGKALERILVVTRIRKDPFDTYDYIRSIHERYGLSPLFFILCADYGGNDNNIPATHPLFRQVVTALKRFGEIGIHPSILSNKNPMRMEREISSLMGLAQQKITRSRQHFLIIDLPSTYLRLIRSGIRDDYSMGFAALNGFRAGIASSFFFFDLNKNEELPIRVHPVAFMDVTLKNYLHLTPEEGIAEIRHLMDAVHSVGGECIGLWHNESLSDKGEWKGWRDVFEEMLIYADKLKQ